MYGLRALSDTSPVAWLVDALVDTPHPVGRVVPRGYQAYARVYLPPDEEGTIDSETCNALIRVLTPFTPHPESCYFAIWKGYAGLGDRLGSGTAILPPDREVLIFTGALSDAVVSPEDPPGDRLPNRWWPADHQWCVGSDIYGRTLVIGASAACIAAIVLQPGLTARKLDASEQIPDL